MTADLNVLVRIGAWSVETAERFECGVRLLDLPREGARPSIGSFLNEWLAARVRPRLRSVEPGTAPWLILAAEGLMADYRRGPEHAWKRLAREWRRAVPEARHIEINIAEADEALAEHAAGILRQTAEALWAIASNRNQHASIILMGPFLNGERRAALIDSTRQFIDVDLDSDDLPWIEQIAD